MMATTNELLLNAEHRQPVFVQHFQHVIEQGELAHAYLFAGPAGSGKEELAMWIAMRLFCNRVTDGQPCGECEECLRISQHEHPDVLVVEPDGQSIKVDQVRLLKTEFTKSGVEGNQKVFIVAGAETMTASAANSLLKFLEEPSGTVTAILLTTNLNLILPTVVSRTQELEMRPLAPMELQTQLAAVGVSPSLLPLTMRLTNSAEQAQKWLTDDWLGQAANATWQWLAHVLKPDLHAFPLVATDIMPLAKDRGHQRLLLDMIIAALRDALLISQPAVTESVTMSFPSHRAELATLTANYTQNQLVEMTDLGLQSKQQLERNVSFENTVEALTLQIIDGLTVAQ
ncbi:DNA polymerase III subunit delta' [Furfurilactobacillus entadae]|uniref:DNA polymerase III subunit delta' n=1 Tax=Furfurilactobacillus entadae TaxID=2922307 RepID=UPI0038B34F5C